MLPSAHDKSLPNNAVTREEQLAHVLAERRMAARMEKKTAGVAPLDAGLVFDQAHSDGVRQQNAYRRERGQVDVTDALNHDIRGKPGVSIAEYKLANGDVEYIHSSNYGTIDDIRNPGKPLF